jgi:hypothetical protein
VISGSGIYLISVNESNNPTYLREGLYRVYIDHPYANFRNVRTGSGTFEKLSMLRIFEKQGRVVCTPVSPNREQLEADLVAFEASRAA